jgi:AcrR family transcriptional regulator
MPEAVKKPYSSPLREAQARATRRAIVEAATGLFLERGFGPTTVDAIAEAAGVSRKTVFTSVGGKVEALKLAIDWAIVGDDEPVPLLERPHVRAGLVEPDARRILADYAVDMRRIHSRIAPLAAVVQEASGLEPELRALADRGKEQRLEGMKVLAQVLADRGALKPGLSTSKAADILWLFNDPSVYQRLVVDRQWSQDSYEQWVAGALIGVLIAGDYQPSAEAGRRRRRRP